MIHTLVAVTMFTASVALAGVGALSLWWRISYHGLLAQGVWVEADIDNGNIELAYARDGSQFFPRRGFTRFLGPFGVLRLGSGTSMGTWRYRVLIVPLWMVVAALFIPSSISLRREWIRRRRAKRGECTRCGYNLTGITEPRCPECGRPVGDRCVVCGRAACRRHGSAASGTATSWQTGT